ncbi:MAG TPA: hypothetical protein DCW31_07320 [Lactobacillus sp.]|nr:hypothetical protein [Lactobacillus sp.]
MSNSRKECRKTSREQQIISAFLNLVKDNNYATISITQIMNQAHITRTYFYQFFDNKQALAQEAFFSLIKTVFDNLSDAIINTKKINRQNTLNAVTFMLEHKSEMLLLISFQSKDFNFQTEFQDRISTIIRQQINSANNQSPQNLDYFANVFAASMMATISWFLQRDNVNATTVVNLIDSCVSKGMASIIE